MKKIKELLLPIYVILNLIYISLGSILFTIKKIKYIDYSMGYIILLILNILVLLIIFIAKKNKKTLKFNTIDLLLFFIIIFSIISIIFSINQSVSIFGFNGRYEGILTILYYFSIYMISTYIDKKYKEIIIYTIILFGIINLIYGVFQILEMKNVIIKHSRFNEIWATGFTNNPNFFGTLMLLCLSYLLGLFVDKEEKCLKIIYGLLIFTFMIGLLISNTMSCIVGLLIILFYIIFYTIKEKKYIKLGTILVILLLSSILIIKAGKTKIVKDFIKTTNQTVQITKGNIKDNYGTNRIFIWKNTLKIVPKNIIHGVGIDNFFYAFEGKPLSNGTWVFDKAHNEYLQILITEGIFSLISYLSFYAVIIKRGIQSSFKEKQIYLLLPVMGYLTQAFFNISVIEVAPYFYIALGLLVDRGINN